MIDIKLWNNKKSAFIIAAIIFVASVLSLNIPDANAKHFTTGYNVYNAETGTLLRAYDIHFDEAYNSDGTCSGGVIGIDDREVDWSKSGVVKINDGIGTGFVVDAHTIATAAHCLISENAMKAHIINKVTLYDNNGNVTMEATPVELHVPIEYANRTYDQSTGKINYSPDHDYGIITVEEDLSAYACFNLGTPLESLVSTQHTAYITGFPGTVNNTGAGGKKYTSYGKINTVEPNDIWYNIDSSSGASGSPIYIEEISGGKVYYTVIGINVAHSVEDGGDNVGKRMTAELLKFYKGNTNNLYYW